MARHEQLSDHVQQQVHLQIQPQDVRRMRRVLVGFLKLTVFFQRRHRLQHAQIPVRKTTHHRRIVRLRQTPPRNRQYVFVCQLLVENDGIYAFVHGG